MKRIIEVATRGTKLTLKNSRIQVIQDDETLASIPAEDLGTIVLTATGVSISSGVLKALGTNGGAILSCDDSFHPCGIYMPLSLNSIHSERVRIQAEASEPLKKNLWAKIVRAKIRNQAHISQDPGTRSRLKQLAKKVRSGDAGNLEGKAARYYWPMLFSKYPNLVSQPFRRHRHGPSPNSLLNYGYAVLRASTARALCVAGLHPAIGIHHRNRYSGFCLADDLMEPFRPYIDACVLNHVSTGCLDLTKETRMGLISTLSSRITVGGQTMVLSLALERAASSLAKAMEIQVKEKASATEATEELILPVESKQ